MQSTGNIKKKTDGFYIIHSDWWKQKYLNQRLLYKNPSILLWFDFGSSLIYNPFVKHPHKSGQEDDSQCSCQFQFPVAHLCLIMLGRERLTQSLDRVFNVGLPPSLLRTPRCKVMAGFTIRVAINGIFHKERKGWPKLHKYRTPVKTMNHQQH